MAATLVTGADDDPLRPVLPGYVGSSRQRWLVLHGWAQGAAYWAPLARWLVAAGIVLLCPDLPELAGSSKAPPGSLDRLTDLAGALAERCRPAGVRAVVGHSAGAVPAMLLAHRLPDLDRLVLVEPLPHQLGIPGSATPPVRWAVGDIGESVTDRLRTRYPFAGADTLRTIAAELAEPDAEPALPIRRETDERRGHAVYAALCTLPVPLLVVRGGRSALLSEDGARAVLDSAPTATERVISDAGHSVHLDQPRSLAQLFAALAAEPILGHRKKGIEPPSGVGGVD